MSKVFQVMEGHTDVIDGLAFFHDGRRIASCSRDRTLRIWDMQKGTLIGEPFEGHVHSLAVSPDDRRIVCGGEDKTIIIWDVESKQKVFDPLMKHTGVVASVCFSPDGKRVASGSVDKTVVVWDAATGSVLTTLEGPRHSVLSVAFSPDGLKLASGSADHTIRVWRPDTTELILEINTQIRRIMWSHDGKQLISSSNENVIFWDAFTGRQVAQHCNGHDIAISSDGSFIATADSGLTLYLWSTESHQQIGQAFRHPDPVLHCIAISPNGAFLASAGRNKKLFLWFIGDMLQLHDEQEGWDNELQVGRQPRIIELDILATSLAEVSAPSRCTRELLVPMPRRTMPKPLKRMEGYQSMIVGVTFFHDGCRVVTAAWDKTLRIWDVQMGTLVGEPFEGHKDLIHSVAVSPDDGRIASGGQDNTIIIWDVDSKQKVFNPLVMHTDEVNSVCFSPDGKRVASGSNDNTVIVWDAEAGVVLAILRRHRGPVKSVAFSRDGRQLASGSMDRTILVWHTDKAEILHAIKASSWVKSIVWSPDSQQLIVATGDNTVKFWDATSGHQIGQPCSGHTGPINSIAISSDGSFIATASDDQTVRLWSTRTQRQIEQAFESHGLSCTAISPNGELLAGVGLSTVSLWSIKDSHERQDQQENGDLYTTFNSTFSYVAPEIFQGVSPKSRAKGRAHEGPNKSAAHSLLDMPVPAISSESTQDIIQAANEGEEGAHDIELFDLWLRAVRVTHTTQSLPPLEHEGTRVYLDVQSSIGPECTTISQTYEKSSAPQVSFPQEVESDSHLPGPAGAILQDLTASISKLGDFAIARGGFAEVWKCTRQTDQGTIDVAVKALLVYASDQFGEGMEKKTKRIRRELRICASLKHPNILPVYGYTHGFGLLIAIVCPWVENGNLTNYLEHKDATLTHMSRFQILRDISSGLQYLHANNIIHGDLTGPNVLIHGDGTACLADFGLSLMYSEIATPTAASWTSSFHGNFRWLAPELLGESDDQLPVRPSKHSDVYSFGGITLQVLTGKVPYHYLSDAAVVLCLGTGVKPLRSRYPAFSNEYWRFIEECWAIKPQDRPSAEKVVQAIRHEFDSMPGSGTGSSSLRDSITPRTHRRSVGEILRSVGQKQLWIICRPKDNEIDLLSS